MKFQLLFFSLATILLFSCLNNDEEPTSDGPFNPYGDSFNASSSVYLPTTMGVHLERLRALDSTGNSVTVVDSFGMYYSQRDPSAVVEIFGDHYDKQLLLLRVETAAERRDNHTQDSVPFYKIMQYELAFLKAQGVLDDTTGWGSMVVWTMLTAAMNSYPGYFDIYGITYFPDTSRSLGMINLNPQYEGYMGNYLGSGIAFDSDSGYAAALIPGLILYIDKERLPASKIIPHFVAPVLDSL